MASRPKFVKIINSGDCFSNEMQVPNAFCVKYAATIPLTVKARVRNGYEIWLDFDKENGKFKAIFEFLSHFSIIGEQSLLFEYVGDFNFNVTILEVDGSEIDYPMIVHQLQKGRPKPVSIYNGGWSFAQFVISGDLLGNEVNVPFSFIERVGHLIPEKVEFVMSCGIRIVGGFKVNAGRILGLASIKNMLGIRSCNYLRTLIFKFEMNNTFLVTGFDDSMTGTPIETKMSEIGLDSVSSRNENYTAFEIVVQPSHLHCDTNGVEVLVRYKNITDGWDKVDYITVFKENCCWTLQIRKSTDWKITTIQDGWKRFNRDMELDEGTVCVFHWKNYSIRNFNFKIEKQIICI